MTKPKPNKPKFGFYVDTRAWKRLMERIDQMDADIVRLNFLIDEGNMKAVARAINRVAATLEKSTLNQAMLDKAGAEIKINTEGIREAMKDETGTKRSE